MNVAWCCMSMPWSWHGGRWRMSRGCWTGSEMNRRRGQGKEGERGRKRKEGRPYHDKIHMLALSSSISLSKLCWRSYLVSRSVHIRFEPKEAFSVVFKHTSESLSPKTVQLFTSICYCGCTTHPHPRS